MLRLLGKFGNNFIIESFEHRFVDFLVIINSNKHYLSLELNQSIEIKENS